MKLGPTKIYEIYNDIMKNDNRNAIDECMQGGTKSGPLIYFISGDASQGKSYALNKIRDLLLDLDYECCNFLGLPNTNDVFEAFDGLSIKRDMKKTSLTFRLNFPNIHNIVKNTIDSKVIPRHWKTILTYMEILISGSFGFDVGKEINDKSKISKSKEMVIKSLLKSQSDYIAICIDNFSLLDKYSLELIHDIYGSRCLFSEAGKRLVFLITDYDKRVLHEITSKTLDYKIYELTNFCTEDIKEYFLNELADENNPVSFEDCIFAQIERVTNGIPSLVTLLLSNVELFIKMYEDTPTRDMHIDMVLERIFEKRIDELHKSIDWGDRESLIKIASLIENSFNRDNLSYVSDCDTVETEKYLKGAFSKTLIQELSTEEYTFDCELLRDYLLRKIENQKKSYYEKFLSYYTHNYPNAYHIRAKYAIKAHGNQPQIRVIGLFALAYSRAVLGGATKEKVDEILSDFIQYRRAIHSEVKTNFELAFEEECRLFESMKKGLEYFLSSDYINAFKQFEQNYDSSNPLFECELLRLASVSLLLSVRRIDKLKQFANALLNKIVMIKEVEVDQYAHCLYSLHIVYADKLNDLAKAEEIQDALSSLVKKAVYEGSTYQDFLVHLSYVMSKKANVYDTLPLSHLKLEKCINYFRATNDIAQLYMSYCNYAGCLIYCSNHNSYMAGISSIAEAKKLKKDNDFLPSFEKIEHNGILLNYLVLEEKFMKTADFANIRIEACNTAEQLIDLKKRYSDSFPSQVIDVNIASFLSLAGNISRAKDFIDDAVSLQNERGDTKDNFYDYYFKNIFLGHYVLQQEWNEAQELLSELKSLFPNVFPNEKRRIAYRYDLLQEIITERSMLNSVEYNYAFWKYKSGITQDESWKFLSRGFPISDLIFLSQ